MDDLDFWIMTLVVLPGPLVLWMVAVAYFNRRRTKRLRDEYVRAKHILQERRRENRVVPLIAERRGLKFNAVNQTYETAEGRTVPAEFIDRGAAYTGTQGS